MRPCAFVRARQDDHLIIVSYAIVMAVIYPFGTPLLYAALLYANHEQLERIKRAELTAAAEETKLGDLEGGGEAASGGAARARAPVKVRRDRGRVEWGDCPRLLCSKPPPPR